MPNRLLNTKRLVLMLLAISIVCAPVSRALGFGWTDWQGLGRFFTNPVPGTDPFRLTSSTFVNGHPIAITIDRTGEWVTVMELRNGFWNHWYLLNHRRGIFPFVATTLNGSSQPSLFYRGGDGEVFSADVIRQGTGAVGETRWSAEVDLGRPADAIPSLIYPTRLSGGRVAVCFTDTSTSTIRCRIRRGNGEWGDWSPSERAPGAIGIPMSMRLDSDQRMHLFVNSSDTLFEFTEGRRSPMGGTWRTIAQLSGRRLAAPMAAVNADGRMEVFARGSDHSLWHVYQVAGPSEWSRWESLGRPPSADLPFGFVNDAVVENDDGRLEVFVVAGDANVWHIYQTKPNCCWSDWQSLGHPKTDWKLMTELTAVMVSHKLELFVLDSQGALWTIYQE